jgi:protein O-mannosyl-transferase
MVEVTPIGDETGSVPRPMGPLPGVCILALLLFTLALYWRASGYGFIWMDDLLYVYANPHVQAGLTRDGFRAAFVTTTAGNWHPLTMLSLMLDSFVGGPGPRVFHLSNIALHLLGTLLLVCAFIRLTGDRWQSIFVGAVFALHPTHVESVAWISERKDVLSGVMLAATLLAYQRHVRRRTCGAYLAVLTASALGLMSKSMLATLPLLLLLLDYWPLRRIGGNNRNTGEASGPTYVLLDKLPLFALAAACATVTLWTQRQIGAMPSLAATPTLSRAANASASYVIYLGKLFWPAQLAAMHYPTTETPGVSLLLCVAVLLAITLTALRLAPRRPYLAVGWLWFVISLLPVIGLIQAGPQAYAERYTYLPYIGLSIMLAWGTPELIAGLLPRHGRPVVAVLALAACGAMATVTHAYLPVWENDVTFWQRVAEVNPQNCRSHYNLGVAYRNHGEIERAIELYWRALEVDPTCKNAHLNLAQILALRGQADEAIAHCQAELAIDPRHALAHNHLGMLLADLGRTAEAVAHFEAALRIDPAFAAAAQNLRRYTQSPNQ